MDILKTKKVSLIFAIINGVLTLDALLNGRWLWGSFCLFCCIWCANNYKNAEE